MNKFNIQFIDVEFGWLTFLLINKNKIFEQINASGVYNPFYDYVDIIYDICYKKKKKYKLIIDQEGYDTEINFFIKGNLIYLECETFKNNRRYEPFKGYFKREEIIYLMAIKLNNFYKKNKKEMDDEWYNFSFNKLKMQKILRYIKNKGYYIKKK